MNVSFDLSVVVSRLVAIMRKELEILYSFTASFTDLISVVRNRRYENFKSCLRNCENFENELNLAEQSRDRIYGEICDSFLGNGSRDRTFLELVREFPEDIRPELKKLYFSLRTELHSFRFRLNSFSTYVQICEGLTRSIIGAISGSVSSKDEGSKDMVYSASVCRAGKKSMSNPSSILINAVK